MTRSGTGWPETSKKYRMIAVQLLTEQYDAIPQDVPVSQYVREALEERLLREVPDYERRSAGNANVRGDASGDDQDDSPGADRAGSRPAGQEQPEGA